MREISLLGLGCFVVALLALPCQAGGAKTYQVTGQVLKVTNDTIIVQTVKGNEEWEIARNGDTKVNGELKEGAKVTIQYTMVAASVDVKADKASKTGGGAWAAGKWLGTYVNTLGNTAPTTLVVSQDGSRISGDWKNSSAVEFVNDPTHGRALRWTWVDPDYGTYRILFWVAADGTGNLDYQVTGAKNYSGHVHNFVRQK
jgi:hypothetical protein